MEQPEDNSGRESSTVPTGVSNGENVDGVATPEPEITAAPEGVRVRVRTQVVYQLNGSTGHITRIRVVTVTTEALGVIPTRGLPPRQSQGELTIRPITSYPPWICPRCRLPIGGFIQFIEFTRFRHGVMEFYSLTVNRYRRSIRGYLKYKLNQGLAGENKSAPK